MSGLIPACAGKTRCGDAKNSAPTAHPRVCGENAATLSAWTTKTGSSPRVRGKRVFPQKIKGNAGLIPACAGKTLNDLEF